MTAVSQLEIRMEGKHHQKSRYRIPIENQLISYSWYEDNTPSQTDFHNNEK